MEIVLMGYMGSGKSTVGKYLSEKMNLTFIDLDEYIEFNEGKSIKEIFSSDGEIYFRRQESRYLKEILDIKSNYVLSLGGGTPCYANNIDLIKISHAKSIYLKCNIPTLYNRLKNSDTTRPLIQKLNEQELYEYIGKHLFERTPFYQQSDIKIDVDAKNLATIYSEINTQLF